MKAETSFPCYNHSILMCCLLDLSLQSSLCAAEHPRVQPRLPSSQNTWLCTHLFRTSFPLCFLSPDSVFSAKYNRGDRNTARQFCSEKHWKSCWKLISLSSSLEHVVFFFFAQNHHKKSSTNRRNVKSKQNLFQF